MMLSELDYMRMLKRIHTLEHLVQLHHHDEKLNDVVVEGESSDNCGDVYDI